MPEELDWGDAVSLGERLGAERWYYMRWDGGGGGDVAGGRAKDLRERRVCRAEDGEELSE